MTFVLEERKSEYKCMVDEFLERGIAMYVAPNIGIWRAKSNTLSILDGTIITLIPSRAIKDIFIDALLKQVVDFGFGKQVVFWFCEIVYV